MIRKILLFAAISVLLSAASNAQRLKRCGTMEYLAARKAADPGLEARMAADEEMIREFQEKAAGMKTSNTVITIPVIFHILYNTGAQNISTARIYDQLNTLNKDFAYLNADTVNTPAQFRPFAANTNVQFCLAQQDTNGNFTTGIIRKQVAAVGYDPLSNQNIKYSALGGDDAWDKNNYLNVWVANFVGQSNQIVGISTFPGGPASEDGCCVFYGTVGGETYHGTTLYYNLGRTLTHEVGHWLNLFHVWGQDATCNGDDFVTDTPKQASENFGCVAFPHITCNNGPNGDMFMNYMDYGDDNCLNMFTELQGTRMQSVLNGPRASIKISTKCVDLTGISTPAQISFSVYPNPSTGEFIISADLDDVAGVTVTITSMLGEIVSKHEYEDLPYLVQKTDLSQCANGIYTVEVRTSTAISTRKLALNR
jgi:hypothetical protein